MPSRRDTAAQWPFFCGLTYFWYNRMYSPAAVGDSCAGSIPAAGNMMQVSVFSHHAASRVRCVRPVVSVVQFQHLLHILSRVAQAGRFVLSAQLALAVQPVMKQVFAGNDYLRRLQRQVVLPLGLVVRLTSLSVSSSMRANASMLSGICANSTSHWCRHLAFLSMKTGRPSSPKPARPSAAHALAVLFRHYPQSAPRRKR